MPSNWTQAQVPLSQTFLLARKDTTLEDSKLPLKKWFAAINLFMVNCKGM